MERPATGPAAVALHGDPKPLRLLLHLSHIQSSSTKSEVCSCRVGRVATVRVEKAVSKVVIVEGYRASRMVRGLGDTLADACSGWESDMLRKY